ncbi:hypothetical protein GCM10010191_48540 [Actinomadura vinacea]|uniref:Uncharacterized protein n=1 Tax=Actinomadura vinacea TaxID=115336 RepID=A0ABN3JIU4_9ACTN
MRILFLLFGGFLGLVLGCFLGGVIDGGYAVAVAGVGAAMFGGPFAIFCATHGYYGEINMGGDVLRAALISGAAKNIADAFACFLGSAIAVVVGGLIARGVGGDAGGVGGFFAGTLGIVGGFFVGAFVGGCLVGVVVLCRHVLRSRRDAN